MHIGTREVGIPDDVSIGENSLLSTTTNQAVMDRKRKRGDTSVKDSAVNLQLVLKSITELCNNNKSTPITDNTREKKAEGIANMSLDELYKLVEQYKRQLKFLDEMDMLSDEEKRSMVEKTKQVFDEINKRTNNDVS